MFVTSNLAAGAVDASSRLWKLLRSLYSSRAQRTRAENSLLRWLPSAEAVSRHLQLLKTSGWSMEEIRRTLHQRSPVHHVSASVLLAWQEQLELAGLDRRVAIQLLLGTDWVRSGRDPTQLIRQTLTSLGSQPDPQELVRALCRPPSSLKPAPGSTERSGTPLPPPLVAQSTAPPPLPRPKAKEMPSGIRLKPPSVSELPVRGHQATVRHHGSTVDALLMVAGLHPNHCHEFSFFRREYGISTIDLQAMELRLRALEDRFCQPPALILQRANTQYRQLREHAARHLSHITSSTASEALPSHFPTDHAISILLFDREEKRPTVQVLEELEDLLSMSCGLGRSRGAAFLQEHPELLMGFLRPYRVLGALVARCRDDLLPQVCRPGSRSPSRQVEASALTPIQRNLEDPLCLSALFVEPRHWHTQVSLLRRFASEIPEHAELVDPVRRWKYVLPGTDLIERRLRRAGSVSDSCIERVAWSGELATALCESPDWDFYTLLDGCRRSRRSIA